MKAKRQKVIIAFADITAFGPWARRAEPDEFISVMSKVYDEFSRFHRFSKCVSKLLADGFMAVVPLGSRNEKAEIINFLELIHKAGIRINRILKAGLLKNLRIRVVVGSAWCVTFKDGTKDYLGYQMNYCQRLLDIGREGEDYLLSESGFNALGRKNIGRLHLRKVNIDGVNLSGVDAEDLKTVYSFGISRAQKR